MTTSEDIRNKMSTLPRENWKEVYSKSELGDDKIFAYNELWLFEKRDLFFYQICLYCQ